MYVVKKDFPCSHNGYEVTQFTASDEPQELTPECAAVAVAEGWAVEAKATAPKSNKARAAAPENKSE